MLPGWSSLSLVLVLAAYWLLFLLYALRTTLPAGVYVMFLPFGAIGSGLISLYLQALPSP